MSRYIVAAPQTPGAAPTAQPAATLSESRQLAKTYADRRDLSNQDVRIERVDGQLVEYAGPNR